MPPDGQRGDQLRIANHMAIRASLNRSLPPDMLDVVTREQFVTSEIEPRAGRDRPGDAALVDPADGAKVALAWTATTMGDPQPSAR